MKPGLAAMVGVAARASTVSGACLGPRPEMPALVVAGARVDLSPDEPPIDDAVVVMHEAPLRTWGGATGGGVPPGTRIGACRGQVVTARFWNSHVHSIDGRWTNADSTAAETLTTALRDMLVRHGFTTVFDTGSPSAAVAVLRRRIEAGEVVGP